MPRPAPSLRSVGIATDIDVLPSDAQVRREGDAVIVRSPSNPTHFWGNFLLFDAPPEPGDRERWEARFLAAMGGLRASSHVAFGWDVVEGELGAAQAELFDVGYQPDLGVALIAEPEELVGHPRANEDVEVRALDPAPGADAELWRQVVELQVATREPGHEEEFHRRFVEARMAGRRQRFVAGDGAWYVALDGGQVVASCGVIVTAGRGRYQAVDTAESHRRRGIASRLVADAGRDAIARFGAERLVILAEADYHALPLYESLGFVPRERLVGACWWPGAPGADRHPSFGGRLRQTRGRRRPTGA